MTNWIVGRERELATVERFLDSLGTDPAALAIEGEAGIGKTTIWEETVRAAEARGHRVVQARATESEVRLSFGVLADLVGPVFEETRAALPSVQQRALAAALLLEETDPSAGARTTATAFVGILSTLATMTPVVVAVEDVQWVDSASTDALAFAARRLPTRVGLVVSRRTTGGDETPPALERALAAGRLERVVLGPLSLGALHHVLERRLGSAPRRPLLARLTQASGGNPFFAVEIARALGDPARRGGDEPLPVPRTVEELLAARVGALPAAAREAALAAACLSRPTMAAIVAALGDAARSGVVEAEEAGVLFTERDGIRFSHPLVAAAIYSGASHERRRRLHERLAGVVDDREERARHLALAATEADEATAAELEQVAVLAAARGAQSAALELFAEARRLTPAQEEAALTRRAVREAAARLAAGDVAGARELAEQGARSPVGRLRAEALYVLGEIGWIGGSTDYDESFTQALAAAGDDDAFAARVYPKLVSYNTGHRAARAVEHADAALRALDPERHAGALAAVVFDRLWAGLALGEGAQPERLALWRELEAKAGPEAPKTPLALIYFHSVDEVEAARARHELEDAWYRDRGEDVQRAERLAHRGYAELRGGNWELAERYVEEGCAGMAEVGKVGPWAMPFRLRALVDAHRGRIDQARETLVPLLATHERAPRPFWNVLLLSTLAFVEYAAGEYRAADEAVTRMRERMDALGVGELTPDRSEPFHVESLLALGEVDRARAELVRLEQRHRSFPRLWTAATLPAARALVLAAGGEVAAALAACDDLDSDAPTVPFERAWALLVRGKLERRAKRRRAAAESLRRAAELFERIGAPRFAAEARDELGRVGLRRAPAELTPTELLVAELAATGLTNREVASRAFMSPKTVQANLARVYRKLGIASRAELGARMADELRRGGPQT